MNLMKHKMKSMLITMVLTLMLNTDFNVVAK